MSWLIWREYRLNRWILVSGGMLVLLPLVIAGALGYGRSVDFIGPWILSSVFGYMTVALLAGHAVAGERADRSAEFVAYLPLARWQRIASKLILFLITFAVIWSVVVWGATQVVMPVQLAHLVDVRGFVIASLMIYGMGWLFTSFLSSATYASVFGLSAPVFFLAGLAIVADAFGVLPGEMQNKDSHETLILLSGVFGLPVAAVSFAVGTWNYVRRSD
jgi:ABC-type transport system involved in multi-copper enzyme maturation permease subunit